MSGINKDNYELFALDYIEGKLDNAGRNAFEAFLLLHPDIAEEIEGFDHITFDSEGVDFNTEDLKKGALLSDPINVDNAEHYFIAYHEGDLNEIEVKEVELFLAKNPEKETDFKQVGLLHFVADENIHFPLKRKVKKALPLFTLKRVIRVAAIFILLFSLGLYLFTPKEAQEYTARNSKLEFPEAQSESIDLVFPDLDQIVKVDQANMKSEKAIDNSTQETQINESPEIQLAQSNNESNKNETEVVEDITIAIDEEVSEDLSAPEEIIVAMEEGSNLENTANVEIVDPIQKEKSSKSIFKFKRPFKRSKKEDDLLASNDSESIIKIANPLKKKWAKNRSFGPIKVKKSN